jgi:hypothetical protein
MKKAIPLFLCFLALSLSFAYMAPASPNVYLNANYRLQRFEPYTAIKQLAYPIEFHLRASRTKTSVDNSESSGFNAPLNARYVEKGVFNVNSSIQSLSITMNVTTENPDFDIILKKPDGTTASYQEIINISSPYWGGMKSIDADVASKDAGEWSLELVNNTDADCTVIATVCGDSGSVDNAYYNSIQIGNAPTGMFDKSANGEYAYVYVATSRGRYYYSGIKQEIEVFNPDGNSYAMSLKDDGKDGDSVAGNGLYTGKIKVNLVGRYLLRSKAGNGDAGKI